ncbi:toxin-antitoxin system HicB family antitoxin [Ramlibacter tataouinensis]|uniref:HicB-like antitoxin of toxin-antitoxin system domain-containing protein n=1 Tax=Ramlibacter tataouinensis (strain ATCC BAA-407 / DSM 14655 / LMG 21543 / TTB310) TaxID=365046 RepID=F5XZW3_RAMTT|nr:toxin-antitoxin system HicB family antitoxin [Ramlibacter tataouinensis]AEG93324.1 Conserved hypothetical protein [Ramlibacter tataouinensis TTB310]
MKMTRNIGSKSAQRGLPSTYVRRLTVDPDGGYVATVHELPGCIGSGKTGDEALSSLEGAATSWIQAHLAAGQKLPDPANYDECSGKIALRISRRLHMQAAERADLEGTSLNQLIATALARYLSTADARDEIRRALESRLSDARLSIYNDNRTYVALTPSTQRVESTEIIDSLPARSKPLMMTLGAAEAMNYTNVRAGERTLVR